MAITDEKYFLFTADCHIKRRTWTNSALLQGDATKSLMRLFEQARNKADTVLIGGDLFDSNRPTSLDLTDAILYLKYNFRVAEYIRGNHDSVDPPFISAFEDDDSKLIINVLDVEDWMLDPDSGNVKLPWVLGDTKRHRSYLCGVPYVHSTEDLIGYMKHLITNWKQIRNPGDTLYMMLHASFKELLGFDGAYQLSIPVIKELCGEEKINILVGHIHTRATFVYNDAGAYIHSPGSTYPLSTADMDKHFFGSLIDVHTGEITDIPCDVRKYVTINAKDLPIPTHVCTSLDQLGHTAPEGFLPTFVRIVVDDDWEGSLQDMSTPSYIIQIIRKGAVQQAQISKSTQYTLQEAVAEELAAEPNSEMLLDMANALLSSDDQVALLDEWTKGWGVRKVN